MAARRGFVEDLLDLGTRLSWKTCLAAAVVSAVALHGLASLLITTAPPGGLASLGGYAVRNLAGMLLRLFGVLVPVTLVFAALISALRRSHAASLHERAHAGGIDAVRRLSWTQFERLIGEIFRNQGFDVQETGNRTKDGGVDLVLAKNGREYLVQCKHWRAQSVGVTMIRELNGVVAARGASGGGFVVTSGTFTSEARAFAGTCPIELVDVEQLEALFQQSQAAAGAGNTARIVSPQRVAQPRPSKRSSRTCGVLWLQPWGPKPKSRPVSPGLASCSCAYKRNAQHQRRYAHLAPDQRREAVAKLNEKPILALTMRLPWEGVRTSSPYPIEFMVEREGLEPSTPAL